MMNLPNIISLSRIPLLFVILALFHYKFQFSNSLALIVYVFASFTDWLDGFCARKFNSVSSSGKLLDALTDKIFVLGLFIILLQNKMIPAWMVVLILLVVCREFLIVGLRMVAVNKQKVLAAERSGKLKTIFQMTSIGILIFHVVILKDFGMASNHWFSKFAYDLGLAIFIISILLTIYSGLGYIVKYGYLLKEEHIAK